MLHICSDCESEIDMEGDPEDNYHTVTDGLTNCCWAMTITPEDE